MFPRRTRATPCDEHAYVGEPHLLVGDYDEVHVSVTWTYDIPEAERLARLWQPIAPVSIGGPALGDAGGDFVPGMYVKPGYVITSRGCPNRCWFCSVWKREGNVVRELPVVDGWNVLDDNLLASSREHIDAVFSMLSRQPQQAEFTGGLEAAKIDDWVAGRLASLRLKQLFCAYDTPDDYDPLVAAGRILSAHGIGGHKKRCYVLVGWPKDTMLGAERRMLQTIEAGFMPMAMLWRGKDGSVDRDWRQFQREWARPHIVGAKMRAIQGGTDD